MLWGRCRCKANLGRDKVLLLERQAQASAPGTVTSLRSAHVDGASGGRFNEKKGLEEWGPRGQDLGGGWE